jgi:hypothetical protein
MPQYSDDLFLGPAQTFMGTGIRPYSTTATGGTGSVSSATMTVTAVGFGAPIVIGMYVDGTSVTDGTYITGFGTGTGGVGTYTVSTSQLVASTAITATIGPFIVTYGSYYKFPYGAAPTFDKVAGRVNILSYSVLSSTSILVTGFAGVR